METKKKLEWDDKYSVEVEEIDNQHKLMFKTINELIDAIYTTPTKEKLEPIIEQLINYKKYHFATEEKYFIEFNYEKKDDHIAKHRLFTKRLEELQGEAGEDQLTFAFKLVDFLEDWLIDHLMTVDQEYKACFKAHGLK